MQKNDKNQKRKKMKIFIIILATVLLIASIPTYIFFNKLSKIKTEKINNAPEALSIDEKEFKKPQKNEDDFVNILLLGIDSRDTSKDSGRSDSMMIATIDKKHNKIKLTSLMRDTIVTMVGHGPMEGLNQDRLNHSFAYGGALLTMKTINENFNMNVKNYIKVDFFGLEKIIENIGGVPINVKQEEISLINGGMSEVSKIEKQNYIPISKAGLQTLNGKQAVAYCRIRYVGNADFERTERQRSVLTEVFKKLSQKSVFELPKLADVILPNIETSLSKTEILSLGTSVITNKISTVEQLRLPSDDLSRSTYVRDTYFIGWDKEPTIQKLHKFIYETE